MTHYITKIDKKIPLQLVKPILDSTLESKKVYKTNEREHDSIRYYERLITDFENGKNGIAFDSINNSWNVLLKLLTQKNDNIIVVNAKSIEQASFWIKNEYGVEVRYIENENIHNISKYIDDNTRFIYTQTIDHRTLEVPDFEKIRNIKSEYDLPWIVENGFGGSGLIFKPFNLEADLVISGLENWISGYIKPSIVVIEKNTREWYIPNIERKINGSIITYIKNIIPYKSPWIYDWQHTFNIDPKSISKLIHETSKKTHKTAIWLLNQPFIEEVKYVGITNSSSHINALKYFENGFGNILIFRVKWNEVHKDSFLANLFKKKHLINSRLRYDITQDSFTLVITDDTLETLLQLISGTYYETKYYL